jgi:hypothetical protein
MIGLSWLEIRCIDGLLLLGLVMLGIVLETNNGKGFHQELIYA